MLYSFFLNLQKMLGVALPFGFATPTFIIEPFFARSCAWRTIPVAISRKSEYNTAVILIGEINHHAPVP